MNKKNISDIYKKKINFNSYIKISGWVKNLRHSNIGITFINVYDGSYFLSIQVLAKDSLINYKRDILKLNVGCSIEIQGILIKSLGKGQIYDLLAKKINIIGFIKKPNKYPISPKKHKLEYLRKYSHLRPRTNIISAICRIRNVLFHKINNFLLKSGYYWIPTPIITGLNTEGSGDMFSVSFNRNNKILLDKKKKSDNFKKSFFGKESFLTVSGQLTLETYASAFSKVYSFGPVFRAENSNTIRHLAEFWMLEIEQSFLKLNSLILFSEKLIKYVIRSILKKCTLELDFLKNNNKNIISKLNNFLLTKFSVITYQEAINILFYNNKLKKIRDIKNIEISSKQERYLVDEYFKSPLVIINFPKKLKAFYMRLNNDNETVASMDLLLPGVGEVLGGSEREERLNILDENLIRCQLNKSDYWWYRDLRKYGTVLHSGFGLGIERLLSFITGIVNVRDIIPFPRVINSIDF